MIAFLSPLFLAGALAIAIPVVLHLLKKDTEVRVKFPAVRLLLGGQAEETEKRRLRELLLLALRVSALLLLSLAFARPFLKSTAADRPESVTIVALDTSLSMSAPGQFARAQELARQAIARAPTDLVGVVTFAAAARVAAPPARDHTLAEAAVERAEPGYGATRYRTAFNTAAQLLDAAAAIRSTIVVVSDLQETGWDNGDCAAIPGSVTVEVVDVGTPPPNVAVTSARQEGSRVVATVRSSDSRERQARVRLAVDGRTADETTATLPPNQSVEVVLAGARGTDASVSVDDKEGVQGDNTRYLVLDGSAGRRASIAMVTTNGDSSRDAFYLEQGLSVGGPDGTVYPVESIGASRLSDWTEDRLLERAAILLLSTRGLDRQGRELLNGYVSRGGGMLVALGDEIDGDAVSEILAGASLKIEPSVASPRSGPVTLAPADSRHPVFQVFARQAASLGLVKFRRFGSLAGPGCQTLARFSTGEAALVDCAQGEGRAVAFASDLDNRWNDFPVHATFVPFLHEVIRYLAGSRVHRDEYLVGDGAAGSPAVPGVTTRAEPAASGTVERRVAVNVDPGESEPRRLSVAEFQASVDRLKDVNETGIRAKEQQEEDRQHVWQYLLALMVAGLVVESLMGRRV